MNKIKVQILRETTVWDKVKGFHMPNHTYILDASTKRLIAYIKEGTKDIIRLSGRGFTFDRARRTFDVTWRYI